MIRFAHFNFNVIDLEKSLKFYEDALGLKPVRTKELSNAKLVYIGNEESDFVLELTELFDRTQAYDLGECEFIWLLRRMTSADFMKNTGRWVLSSMKIKRPASISLQIPTGTGSRSSRITGQNDGRYSLDFTQRTGKRNVRQAQSDRGIIIWKI